MLFKKNIFLVGLLAAMQLPSYSSTSEVNTVSIANNNGQGSYLKAKLVLAAGFATWALIKAKQNRNQINELEKVIDYGHPILGDDPIHLTKFYKWGLNKWPTDHAINENKKDIIESLAAQREGFYIAIQNTLVDPTWNNILARINNEIEQIRTNMRILENDHLVYNIPGCGLRGIIADYEYACSQAPKDARGESAHPASPESWTCEQARFINGYMDNPWPTSIKPYGSSWTCINTLVAAKDYVKNIATNYIYKPVFHLIKPNYDCAAKIYRKLHISLRRLKELKKIIEIHFCPEVQIAPVLNNQS